jgi:hypothetical protein
LDACDFGRPGGGPGGTNVDPIGVFGVELASVGGIKFDRARMTVLFGGDVLRSIAEAERAGGMSPMVPFGSLGPVLPGEVV